MISFCAIGACDPSPPRMYCKICTYCTDTYSAPLLSSPLTVHACFCKSFSCGWIPMLARPLLLLTHPSPSPSPLTLKYPTLVRYVCIHMYTYTYIYTYNTYIHTYLPPLLCRSAIRETLFLCTDHRNRCTLPAFYGDKLTCDTPSQLCMRGGVSIRYIDWMTTKQTAVPGPSNTLSKLHSPNPKPNHRPTTEHQDHVRCPTLSSLFPSKQ